MQRTTIFQGIWVPIVTPFDGESPDLATLSRLARHLATQGITGFVTGATTGEGALLTQVEQESVFAALREAVPGLPTVVGLSQADTRTAAQIARSFAGLKPDGLLVTAPPYVRPSQEGVRRHFETITEAADLPVLIYNIPYRTGVDVEIETLQSLARDNRVAGIKECGSSVERMLRLVHETPLSVLSGDDAMNFAALCLGAHGTIAASAHVRPDLHVKMHRLLQQGALDEARCIAVALQDVVRDLFAEPNPAPLKALLADMGFGDGSVRLPFVPVQSALRTRLRKELERLANL